MAEIKNLENAENLDRTSAFKEIKPETSITVDDAKSILRGLFNFGEKTDKEKTELEKTVDNYIKDLKDKSDCPETIADLDTPVSQLGKAVDLRNCPLDNGEWTGERGNSKWIPDENYTPQKSNPDNKTWGELLSKHSIDGINFKDGEPDFSVISKGEVQIEDFGVNRSNNFDKANIELAKQKGCSPEDVEKWMKDNHYTWHECSDMKTMQKVPSEIHNNIPHRGGVSAKKGE